MEMTGAVVPGELVGDAVHVWRARLGGEGEEDSMWRLLDDGERQRACRQRDDRVRARFVAGRATLRCILSRYLGTNPERIQFSIDAHGKPYISGSHAASGLVFNLSHSGERVAIAVATCAHVGVDVEVWRNLTSLDGLVERCFAEEERHRWHDLPAIQRAGAFFDHWTLKEAFVKAVGKGIVLGLKQCVVRPGERPEMMAVPVGCGEPGEWALRSLDFGSNVSGAVAVRGRIERLQVFDYEGVSHGG